MTPLKNRGRHRKTTFGENGKFAFINTTPISSKERIDAYVGIKWSGQKLLRVTTKEKSREGGDRMPNKIMMTAADIMEELSVSESFAYGLIRKFNAELKEKGFTIIRGKISRKYFEEQFYGMSERNREGA